MLSDSGKDESGSFPNWQGEELLSSAICLKFQVLGITNISGSLRAKQKGICLGGAELLVGLYDDKLRGWGWLKLLKINKESP